MRVAWFGLLFGACASSTLAQSAPSHPVIAGEVVVDGSLRARVYSWSWFGASANGDYTYPGSLGRLGFSQSKKKYEWQLEFALPFVVRLPPDAIAPGAQGQLGLGATYFAANDNVTTAAALFIKQASVRLKAIGGVEGQSLRVGRLEFNDGTEVMPRHPALAALKRDRITQRLLGSFAFSDVGRSIDGVQYSLNRKRLNVTFVGGRATQGVFQVNGWHELKVNIFYGALTGQLGRPRDAGEWRVFGLAYDDHRRNVLKTDNRPLETRRADAGSVAIATYGAHYVRVGETRAGSVDVLFWGAIQAGSWGALGQRAGAFAAEVGWQLTVLDRIKPWFRGGYNYGSGDSNPTDTQHGTFFQVLPTPRLYARFPFFNMMNTADAFGELILRPAGTFTLRADIHALRLADANDLWYLGGGAFQPATFGYTGRPSNGQSGLATLYDASADYNVSSHVAFGMYYGYAAGKPVTRAVYMTGNRAHFGYGEILLRF